MIHEAPIHKMLCQNTANSILWSVPIQRMRLFINGAIYYFPYTKISSTWESFSNWFNYIVTNFNLIKIYSVYTLPFKWNKGFKDV